MTDAVKLPPMPWGDDLEEWLEPRSAHCIETAIRAYAIQAVMEDRAARNRADFIAAATQSYGVRLNPQLADPMQDVMRRLDPMR